MLEIDMNKNLGKKKKREDSSFPTASFFVSFFGKALMGSCTSCTHRSLDGWPDEARMTAQQRMASTLPAMACPVCLCVRTGSVEAILC